MFKYICAEDGTRMYHSRNEDLQSYEDDNKKKIITISLGSWKCPKCGGKKVKREKINGEVLQSFVS